LGIDLINGTHLRIRYSKMNYKLVQKSLGRKPNKIEKLFFEKFWKSFQNQSCFNIEVKKAEIQTILEH